MRSRAIRTLAARGEAALTPLADRLHDATVLASGRGPGEANSRGPAGRIDCVWTACRIDQPLARALVRDALDDPDPMVRQASAHAAGLWRDREAESKLIGVLRTGPAPASRAAAEALGRIGEKSAVPALLEAAGHAEDRIMDHAITFALIEIADPGATGRGLESSDARTRRAAMIALDQMDGGRLDARSVAGLLASSDPGLKEAASWIVGRHPEWAGELAGVLGAAAGAGRPRGRRAGRAGASARPLRRGGPDPAPAGRAARRSFGVAHGAV